MLLTDELLQENADRLNQIVEFATVRGDDGPALGVLIMLALDDADFEFVVNDGATVNPNRFQEIMVESQVRFQAFGIADDD